MLFQKVSQDNNCDESHETTSETCSSNNSTPSGSVTGTPRNNVTLFKQTGNSPAAGRFSGYLSRESFSGNKKPMSNLLEKQKESFMIKSKCVFDAAFKDILQKLNEDGELSIDVAISLISLYQNASDVVKTYFPTSQPSNKILLSVTNELAKFGISPDNTLFAQSICPNEVKFKFLEIF